MDLTIAVATTDPEAVGRSLRLAALAGEALPDVEVVLFDEESFPGPTDGGDARS